MLEEVTLSYHATRVPEKKLDDKQREVAAVSPSRKSGQARYTTFISDVSPSAALRYLAEFDLTRWVVVLSILSSEQYAQEGYDYIVGLNNDGVFSQDPSLVWAVDFTSTAIK